MRPIAETPRHRAHLTKPGRGWAPVVASAALFVAAALGSAGCGGGRLPRPAVAPVSAADYVEVPFAPRTPTVEVVPERPSKTAVWVDGSWDWSGDRFRWVTGAWVTPPPGARRAPWVLVRREADGQLFFAPAVWKDAGGRTIPDPAPVLRARTRLPREGVAEEP